MDKIEKHCRDHLSRKSDDGITVSYVLPNEIRTKIEGRIH